MRNKHGRYKSEMELFRGQHPDNRTNEQWVADMLAKGIKMERATHGRQIYTTNKNKSATR